MKEKWVAGMAALMLAAGLFGGCSVAGKEIVFESKAREESVFSVNSADCTMAEAKLYLCNYRNLYGTAYGVNLWEYGFGDDSLEDYVKEVTIDELSRIYCMEQIAKLQGISLTGDESKKIRQMAKDYFNSLTGDEIKYMGITEEQLEEYYSRYAVAHKLYDTMTEGVSMEVSDDDARVIRINQIYVTDQDKAGEVAGKLAAGADFLSLAGSYNEASNLELTAARGTLPPEVEEAAFELGDGQVSDMVGTEDGFYFIQCVSKFEEELTQANKAVIQMKREQEQFDNAYSSFIDGAQFQMNSKLWADVHFEKDVSAIETNSFFAKYEENFGGETE